MAKRKQDACSVCGKPGHHKHRYQYCLTCLKETIHVIAVFGLPWICSKAHPDDGKKCERCKQPLRRKIHSLVAQFGANKSFCLDCSALIGRPLFLMLEPRKSKRP